jgi:hypothetical protein
MTDESKTPSTGEPGARNCGQFELWRQVLYRENLDFARNEIIAIWLRYSAVLAIQVLLVKQLADEYHNQDGWGWPIALLALLGFLLSVLWFFLNLGGWLNQDLHIRRADQALPSTMKDDVLYRDASLTYFWRSDENIGPRGPVYSCAQALPIVFATGYAVLFVLAWSSIVEIDCIALGKVVLTVVILAPFFAILVLPSYWIKRARNSKSPP